MPIKEKERGCEYICYFMKKCAFLNEENIRDLNKSFSPKRKNIY